MVVAPDSFGGTLTARQAADAIAAGWLRARPDDDVVAVPLSDGGEGLLDVVAGPGDDQLSIEAVGPLGLPVDAGLLLRPDGTAVIESAQACGLHLVAPERRDPLRTTTYGVGQLLDAAREAGARHVVVGLGGSATVDGGTGALSALGLRLRIAGGGGLKVGGAGLHRVAGAERGWMRGWDGIEVELLADVSTPLTEAARVFGPQKGATPEVVAILTAGLASWADVVERDLTSRRLRDEPGTGAAGGLGYALAAALGARFRPGAATVADLLDLDAALAGAHVVVTGEGRVDATSTAGKVIAEVVRRAADAGIDVVAVAGQVTTTPPGVSDHEAASPGGPGADPAHDVTAAAQRLAQRARST